MSSVDRRDFLKLVGVSASSAAAVGCAEKVEKLIPYVVQPEEITPGNAVYYASTCTECSAGCGLHVKTRESRPIKLEGNPESPINRGALCARAQASIGRTYSPDRYTTPMRLGEAGLEATSWNEAIQAVAAEIAKAPAKVHVLGGDPGATASDLVDQFLRAIGGGGRTVYESFSGETLREATRTVFGVASEPVFDVSSADVIVDFGAEMLESGPSVVEHERQWSEARDVSKHHDGGARLVYVGPRLSLTASSSDQWLPASAGSEGALALGIAAEVARAKGGSALLSGPLAGASADTAAEASGLAADEIRSLAKGLAKAKAAVALPPGVAATSRRAIAATQAVLLLNEVLGATGSRMIVPAPTGSARERSSYRNVLALIEAMKAGKVGVLLVHDANPLYSLPASAGFAEALAKVGTVVSFATARDETSEAAHWVLPNHAPLESWGDGRPRAGTRTLQQPSFRPLYDTRALADTLLDLGRAQGADVAARLPEGSFRSRLEQAWSGSDFRAAQKRGGSYGPTPHEPVSVNAGLRVEAAKPLLTGGGSYTLMPVPHIYLGDGSGAALPWMQEIPEPTSSIAWDSWAEVSLETARSLGVDSGDIVTVEGSAGSVEVAVFPRGGIRDDVIAIPTGQGHTVGHFASKAGDGMPGMARGVNVSALLPGDAVDESGSQAWLVEQVSITPTGRYRRLPQLQFFDNKRGRELGEAITLSALLGESGHGDGHASTAAAALAGGQLGGGEGEGHGDGHGGSHEIIEEYDPADDARNQQFVDTFKGDHPVEVSPYRWGMSIDLDKCTGCGSCIAACYVENNIPVVGEAETRNLRQMAWLRLDRWAGEGEADLEGGRIRSSESREQLGDTDIRNSPMMCQHCGAAPCEPVCPVIATYHNEEGFNAMVYNRCIGTRYCANNCPYKVRRYNYFDNQITKWPEPMELGLNPDVTVRGQGVMEKCTMCVQRVQEKRQVAKHEGRIIEDGEVRTACQQTCGTGAIVFGNLRDDDSQVSKLADDDKRGYHALQVLNTRPAQTYLKKVVRGPVQG